MAQLKSTNIFGTLRVSALAEATSTTSASLVIDGGVGIGKRLYVGGNLFVVGSTTLTGTINGLAITPVTNKTLDLSVASFKSGTGTATGAITISSNNTTARTVTLSGSPTLVAGTMVPDERTITINSGNGITGGSAIASNLSANRSWTLGLSGQAKAFHDLNTNGIVVRTGSDTVSARTIKGTDNRIIISNDNGVSGNPTIDIASNYVGQNTITTVGTISGSSAKWQGSTVAVAYGGTGSTSVSANTILKGNSTANAIVASNITDNGTTITLGKDTVISGNLTVNGTTTTVNTTDLYIGDNIITLNSDLPGTTDPTQNAGIEINRGKSTNVSFLWDESVDKWTVGTGTIVASQFEGNASTVTNGVYTTGSYSDPSWLTISKTKVGLSNVENTALSTWAGTTNITTVGSITATSVNKVTITAPATSATLTIANGKTLTVSNTITLAGTDSKTLNIGSGGTLGTGAFADAYVHPKDGGGSISTALTGANVISAITVNTLGHVTGTSTRELTPSDIGAEPAHSHPYLSTSTTSTQSGYFGNIYLKDDTDPSHYLIITDAENLTANRTLSLSVDNANRTLKISGNAVISGTNTGDQTVGDAKLTLVAGTGITLSTTPSFTANATTNKDITITNDSPNVTTNISITHNATTVVVNSSDGTDGTINGATSTKAGVVTNAAQTWAGAKTFTGNVTMNGDLEVKGYLTESSDRRLKVDINPIDNALDKIMRLSGCTFKKINSDKVSMGLIAQDTQEVIPEVVSENGDGYLGIQYANIVALLIEAIKEQQEQINYLKSKVDKKKWWKIF